MRNMGLVVMCNALGYSRLKYDEKNQRQLRSTALSALAEYRCGVSIDIYYYFFSYMCQIMINLM